MKKTIILFIFILAAFTNKSHAQHFIASHGAQHSWNVPRFITDVVYDHYYDFNWVHAARIYNPNGYDYHVILQRNDLFVEVELSYDGYIRNVNYFDYYPLHDHVCVDYCGFHSPFYNTYYQRNARRFNYGISFVNFRPSIRATYYHPFRYTRRARFYNVYSPYRYRRNYTRVYRRSDHHFYGDRYYGARNYRNRRSTYSRNNGRDSRRTYTSRSNTRNNNRNSNARPYDSRSNSRISGRDSQRNGTRSSTSRSNNSRQSSPRTSSTNSTRNSSSSSVSRPSTRGSRSSSNVTRGSRSSSRSSGTVNRRSGNSNRSSDSVNRRSNSSSRSNGTSSRVSRSSSNKRSSSGRSSSNSRSNNSRSSNSSRSRSRGN